METSLIVGQQSTLPKFAMSEVAKAAKNDALEKAALIGKVTGLDSKTVAVRAQQALKSVIAQIEKARKELKEPLLIAGRQLDTLCAAETLELDKEFGRVSYAVKEFDDAERRRVLEEERLQREELARIEQEKQAELKRLADEQSAREAEARRIQEEADRKVREAHAAAAKLAAEATNKKQREAAEKARQEALQRQEIADAERRKLEATLRERADVAQVQSERIRELADDAAFSAAKPIEITSVTGQRTSTNWVITVTNPFDLARHHPDLVNITPRLAEIKAALNQGREIRGIAAIRETVAGVRVPAERKAIDV